MKRLMIEYSMEFCNDRMIQHSIFFTEKLKLPCTLIKESSEFYNFRFILLSNIEIEKHISEYLRMIK